MACIQSTFGVMPVKEDADIITFQYQCLPVKLTAQASGTYLVETPHNAFTVGDMEELSALIN